MRPCVLVAGLMYVGGWVGGRVGHRGPPTRFEFVAMTALVFTLRSHLTFFLSFFSVVHYGHNFSFHGSPKGLAIKHSIVPIIRCLNRVHQWRCHHRACHLHVMFWMQCVSCVVVIQQTTTDAYVVFISN